MPIDIHKACHFEASPSEMWRNVALIAAFAIGSTLAACSILPGTPPSWLRAIAGLSAASCFVILLPLVLRALKLRGVVVTLSPQGFRDIRVARGTIPWSSVESVRILFPNNAKQIILKVRRHVLQAAGPTWWAWMNNAGNRFLGVKGFPITGGGLVVPASEVVVAVEAYFSAYGRPAD